MYTAGNSSTLERPSPLPFPFLPTRTGVPEETIRVPTEDPAHLFPETGWRDSKILPLYEDPSQRNPWFWSVTPYSSKTSPPFPLSPLHPTPPQCGVELRLWNFHTLYFTHLTLRRFSSERPHLPPTETPNPSVGPLPWPEVRSVGSRRHGGDGLLVRDETGKWRRSGFRVGPGRGRDCRLDPPRD